MARSRPDFWPGLPNCMEHRSATYAIQLPRIDGSTFDFPGLQISIAGSCGWNIFRQYCDSGISEQVSRAGTMAVRSPSGHMVHGIQVQHLTACQTSDWHQELACRQSQQVESQFEWKLESAIFHILNSMWGPFTVDRLASFLMAQLPQ